MEEAEKDEAKRAARRAYKSEWQRKKRQERQASGVCVVCGGPRGGAGMGDAYKGMCLTCTEDVRRREMARRDADRLPPHPKTGWRRKVSVRVCRHCRGRNLAASGPPWARTITPGEPRRQRFLCLDCQKWSYGAALPLPPELLCPYCRGRCVRAGVLPSGSQQYKCVACERKNTNLFPGARKDASGPFRRVALFYFGPLGGKALTDYCNHHRIGASRALREILRAAAVPLVPVMATATHSWPLGSRRQVSHVRLRNTEPDKTPLRDVPRRLPDIRRAVNRARMNTPGGRRYRPVGVESRVAAGLDDRAWEGLIRTMRWRGVTHQEAMRALLMEAWRRL